MSYNDFLNTVKVIRMLYGRDKAEKFFKDNIKRFENIVDIYS